MSSIRRRPFFAVLTFCTLLAGCAAQPDSAPPADPDRPWVGAVYDHQAAAVSHPLAAKAALAMLNEGGSAVDAAIAAQMVMTLVEPQSSGIGGGGFLVHLRGRDGKLETYDGRETAPASAREDMFLDHRGQPIPYREAILGGRAVGVPGLMRMLELAHRDHGKLAWARLFQPAIRFARAGFPISERLARQIAGDRLIHRVPATKAYFYDGDTPKPAGTILKNPALADTLETLADQGAEAFYSGPIARAIVRAVADAPQHPAILTLADIAAYQAKKRAPVCADYHDYKVCGMGPPSSGGVAVGQIMGLLSHFPLADHAPNSPEALHLIAEAGRLAFADRAAYLGDADVVPVPTRGLVDPGYLAERAKLIDPDKANDGIVDPGVPPGAKEAFLGPDDPEKGLSTAHMSIADRDGNVVSFTTTVESAFGSRLMAKGFILNNQLTDFSFRPTWRGKPAPNRPAPGKRPRSSMSPTIVLDPAGKFVLETGSPGGSRIIGYTVRSALGVLTWGLDMQSAIDLPHAMNRGGVTSVAQELAGQIPALTEMGHRVEVNRMISGLQGIEKVAGGLTGGADKRREGVVLGDAGDNGRADFGAGNAYVCNNGSVLTLAWAKVGDDDFVRWREDGQTRTLARVISGSGARYSDGIAEVWEHQGEVRVTGRGGVTRRCKKAL